MKPLVLYHGARHWEGPPQVKPSRAKRAEYGPGLYLTTSFERAKKYAKGGGHVVRFEVEPFLVWGDRKRIGVEQMVEFLGSVRGLRNRPKVIADIHRYAERVHQQDISADVLVNLMVNHDTLRGGVGPYLASFLVKHGIDALHTSPTSGEQWVVLLNMQKIISYARVTGHHPDTEGPVRNNPTSTSPLVDWFWPQ